MKNSLEREIFWKVLVWRLMFSIPLSMLINYIFYQSISVVLELTVVSNIIGHIAHYLFEINWPKIWKLLDENNDKKFFNGIKKRRQK
jgi:uncharacterized membrane protein